MARRVARLEKKKEQRWMRNFRPLACEIARDEEVPPAIVVDRVISRDGDSEDESQGREEDQEESRTPEVTAQTMADFRVHLGI
jgi:hypothetical protein